MKCENLQFNLTIYTDNSLTGDERALVDEHLARCPLCRQKLADFQELKNSLRALARPEIPKHVLNSVRNAVAVELETTGTSPLFLFPNDTRNWVQSILMPYSIGVVTSLFLGFMVLGVLLSGVKENPQSTEIAAATPKYNRPVMLTNSELNSNDFVFDSNDTALSPKDFAGTRFAVSGESPTVNPTGALVALTKSLVRGEMKDEEVVVVADVFSNGLAQIARVIEAPQDAQVMSDLQKALQNDPDYAPFVPASFDRRADSVQIVLKIRRVDVEVNKSRSKNKR